MILNGSPRKNGNTAALVRAFTEGAKEAGNEVQEFYLQDRNIHGCLSCNACRKGLADPCVQKDDMLPIYKAFLDADVVVFATPLYFSAISGTLKTANDRLFAIWSRNDGTAQGKESVLLITSNSGQIEQALLWYGQFMKYSGWKDLGIVSGKGSPFGLYTVQDEKSVRAAKQIGRAIR